MALSGFLVPFASGALIKRQEIADEYDDTAGEIIDAASAKYNEKLSLNNKAIELQNANYAAVENALGTTVAEAAAKNGFLNGVDTNKVVNYVTTSMSPGLIDSLKKLELTDKNIPLDKNGKNLFDSVFKDDYSRATSKLGNQKDWAAKNLNRGAIKNVSDLYLSGGEELPAPTGIEKAQKFLFGDRITDETGATFNLAAEEAIGSNVDVQPNAVMASSSLEERVGYKPAGDLGSILNQDRAIATILNMKDKDVTLSPDGSGIIFSSRFNNHVLAIKDNAQRYVLDYQDRDGKMVDTANLMLRSNQDIENNIISPIRDTFIDYTFDTSAFAESMSFRVMSATNINFSSNFIIDNGLTEKDFIKAKHPRNHISTAKSDIIDGFTLSTKAADAFENEISSQNSMQLQAVYIDYLPDNMFINNGGVMMPMKEYYERIFGIARF